MAWLLKVQVPFCFSRNRWHCDGGWQSRWPIIQACIPSSFGPMAIFCWDTMEGLCMTFSKLSDHIASLLILANFCGQNLPWISLSRWFLFSSSNTKASGLPVRCLVGLLFHHKRKCWKMLKVSMLDSKQLAYQSGILTICPTFRYCCCEGHV